jgi:transposase
MRGSDEKIGSLFSYVDLEDRIPAKHPLRLIRRIVNDALAVLDGEFASLYSDEGRPSIAPERLIRASLLQILFSIRSERQLMEQMDYNLMFRWFVGLGIDDPVWVATVFTKNRDRLLTTEMSRKLMAAILAHPDVKPLLSDDHFSVDGTLIKAWASMKSFQPKVPPEMTIRMIRHRQLATRRPNPIRAKRPRPRRCNANPETPKSSSKGRSGRTPPMHLSPTQTPCSTRSRRAQARCCASWDIP